MDVSVFVLQRNGLPPGQRPIRYRRPSRLRHQTEWGADRVGGYSHQEQPGRVVSPMHGGRQAYRSHHLPVRPSTLFLRIVTMTQKINRIEIDLVPLKLFSRRISEGWAMVPGYPLQPGDYAVTMMPPNFP